MPGHLVAARAMAHFWEEPVISGDMGSGAVFFSGCTLGCCFCQNEPISHGGQGQPVTSARLREIFLDLIEQEEVHNINLVTPTHFLPDILPALTPKLPVPVVYNCGGYERVETLRALEGLVDVYLPDFKYGDNGLAARYSAAGDYVETAKAAILEMFRQVGPVQIGDDGLMKRGVLIRHLILPGAVDSSLDVLDWIADTFREGDVWLSLMAQYTPMGRAAAYPPLDRPITSEEYDTVVGWMHCRGLRHGFLQDFSAASSEYTPVFDGSGL
jgi:putative pyruvate formate lyase activating enzyme